MEALHNNLLSLVEYNLEVAEIALGKRGRQLLEFVQKLDVHPDTDNILSQVVSNDQDLVMQILEVFFLANQHHGFAISKKFSKLVDTFKLSNVLNNPSFGARAFNAASRNEARLKRDVISIDLDVLQKKRSQFWERQPSNFDDYQRFHPPFVDKIRQLEDKADRYNSLGCLDLFDKVVIEREHLTDNLESIYFGFNRMPVTIAALIIAKNHGFKLKTTWDDFGSNIEIVVPANQFYNFDPVYAKHEVFVMADMNSNRQSYLYAPKLYPIHQMLHFASDEVIKLKDELDNCRYFDDFLVLVPGVKLTDSCIREKNGTNVVYKNKEEASWALDSILVEEKYINPVLLGEKDGRSFYICNWR